MIYNKKEKNEQTAYFGGKMLNIAILEDVEKEKNKLLDYITRYLFEQKKEFRHKWFSSSESLLDNYSAHYDIIFMDIELPGMNGMKAAKRLREFDAEVPIIFVTNIAQYASKGYSVDALDFIIKPITYDNFSLAMTRALERIEQKDETYITALTQDGFFKMNVSQIKYVEVFNHSVVYHMTDKTIKTYGSLKDVEDKLVDSGFFKCSRCYLVNIKHVTALNGLTAVLGNEELQISRLRRKDFLSAIANYFGGGGGK